MEAPVYLSLRVCISLAELKRQYKSMLSFDGKERSNFMVGLANEKFNSKLFKACEWSIISR